jgi:4,5-DOPA dioxygenase extradiol
MIPALFVSHGAPTLSLDPGLTGAMWRELAASIVKPDAVLIVSAHWETSAPQVSSAAQPKTIHDFSGFPDALYEIRYPAPGAPQLAARVGELLGTAGLVITQNPSRGLDHGAWVPMRLMYPDADVPCAQLSLQTRMGTRYSFALGQALSELRKENVLILASGGIVHNLGELDWRGNGKATPWAAHFNDWIAEKVEQQDREALLDYRRLAPLASRAHPTEEHLMPFFVALGAGYDHNDTMKPQRIPLGYTYGSLGMDAYLFA